VKFYCWWHDCQSDAQDTPANMGTGNTQAVIYLTITMRTVSSFTCVLGLWGLNHFDSIMMVLAKEGNLNKEAVERSWQRELKILEPKFGTLVPLEECNANWIDIYI
jgi:hypothetical protein